MWQGLELLCIFAQHVCTGISSKTSVPFASGTVGFDTLSKQLMVSGESLIDGIPANKDLGYTPEKENHLKHSRIGRICPFSNFQVLGNLVLLVGSKKKQQHNKEHVGKLRKLHTAPNSSTWTSSWNRFASHSHKWLVEFWCILPKGLVLSIWKLGPWGI